RARRSRVDDARAFARRLMSARGPVVHERRHRRVAWGRVGVGIGVAATLVVSACSSREAADPPQAGTRLCDLARDWHQDVHLLQHVRRADPEEPVALAALARTLRDATLGDARLIRLGSLLAGAVDRYRAALVQGAPLVEPFRTVERLIWRLPAHCG